MHGNRLDSRATTPPHPSFTYSLPAPSEPSPSGRRKSSLIASFVTRAASPSLLLIILALSSAPSLSLADARTPCVKPARIHLASPHIDAGTLGRSPPRGHRSSVRHRSHVGANALSRACDRSSSRIVGPGVRSRKKPVPVPVPCRRCALHHHALHLH